jgi:hypothetical protein
MYVAGLLAAISNTPPMPKAPALGGPGLPRPQVLRRKLQQHWCHWCSLTLIFGPAMCWSVGWAASSCPKAGTHLGSSNECLPSHLLTDNATLSPCCGPRGPCRAVAGESPNSEQARRRPNDRADPLSPTTPSAHSPLCSTTAVGPSNSNGPQYLLVRKRGTLFPWLAGILKQEEGATRKNLFQWLLLFSFF